MTLTFLDIPNDPAEQAKFLFRFLLSDLAARSGYELSEQAEKLVGDIVESIIAAATDTTLITLEELHKQGEEQ